jgi:glycosyltransferase involved in cell wall biosynthesis
VIATRGRSPYLAQAVRSALAQRPAEVLLVEDGPCELAESGLSGVRRLRLAPVGRSAARNAGVAAVETPFVSFLDDDDLALAGGLARLRASLEASPAAGLAFGRVHIVDAAGGELARWNELIDRRFRRLCERGADGGALLATHCPIYTSATMVRREAFLTTGGYDPQLDGYEDLDLYLRLARPAALAPCGGEPVAQYRLHGENTPSDRLYEGVLSVAAKHLPQARGATRRLLLEWRVQALWGLGHFRAARREAARSTIAEPLLLAHPRFARRLVTVALPAALLERRRRRIGS